MKQIPSDETLLAEYRAAIEAGRSPEELWLYKARLLALTRIESIQQRHRRHDVERILARAADQVVGVQKELS